MVREIGRFSTNDGLHHLLSYGELLAMHLLVWSPSLWRPLTTADEVFVPSDRRSRRTTCRTGRRTTTQRKPGDRDPDGLSEVGAQDEPGFTEELERAEIFRAAVPRVARALANTATYMIFDDHEVTDDWYLSPAWRSRVLTAPFGRAVVRNGYAAYAVCQAWGNDPAAFTHDGAEPQAEERGAARHARRRSATDGAFSTTAVDKLDQLLGLTEAGERPRGPVRLHGPRAPPPRAGPRHPHTAHLPGPARAHRSCWANSLDAQLPAGPLTDGRELLVVVSPVPILMPHAIEALVQPLAAGIFDFDSNAKRKAEADHDGPPVSGPERFDVEGWGGDEESFYALVRRLATYPRCVILSGDVHFASGIALDFWSGQDPTVDSRIVQLTSSPVRNSAAQDIRSAIFAARFSQQLLRGLPLERLAGPEKSSITVPPGTGDLAGPPQPDEGESGGRAGRRLAGGHDDPRRQAAGLPLPPDRPARRSPRSRARPIRSTSSLRCRRSTPATRCRPITRSPRRHAELALGPTELLRLLVFRSNLGVVRFEAEGQSHTVVHELYSMDGPDSTEGGAYTVHRASLALSPGARRPVAAGGRRCLSRRRRRRRRGSSRSSPSSSRTSSSGWRRRSRIPSCRPRSATTSASTGQPGHPGAARRCPPGPHRGVRRQGGRRRGVAAGGGRRHQGRGRDAIIDFIEAAKADQVDARVLFATMFKLFAVDLLRVRNPSAYALVRLAGLVLDDEEFLQQLDAAALAAARARRGPGGRRRGVGAAPVDARRRHARRAGHRVGPARRRDRRRLRLGSGSRGRGRGGGDRVPGADGDARPPGARRGAAGVRR